MAIRSNWNYPTAVRFGAGRIAELPDALRAVGINKPLLVTDAGLVNLPVTQNTLKLLRDAGVEAGVFSDVQPNPPGSNVDAGVAVLKAGGHDGVIAFGGFLLAGHLPEAWIALPLLLAQVMVLLAIRRLQRRAQH